MIKLLIMLLFSNGCCKDSVRNTYYLTLERQRACMLERSFLCLLYRVSVCTCFFMTLLILYNTETQFCLSI